MEILPFSVRIGEARKSIADDFPMSARNSLKHLLDELVGLKYVSDWGVLAKELDRMLGEAPRKYCVNSEEEFYDFRWSVFAFIDAISWEKTFDFCERLYSKIVCLSEYTSFGELVSEDRVAPRGFLEKELRVIFREESLAYDFIDGSVVRFGRKNTERLISKSQTVLNDSRLMEARKHFHKAIDFFRASKGADYENSVKEAVCALEAAGIRLFPESRAKTLSELIGWFKSDRCSKKLLTPVLNTLSAIYALRGSANGVSHGAASGGEVGPEISEYVMAVCAAQIVLLVSLAPAETDDVPF